MRFKSKEKAKLDTRRKLWSLFGWNWAFKRNSGGEYKTEYTSDPSESKGYGFFKKNHSLNCYCAMCRGETYRKRKENKSKRLKNKNEIRNLMKVINSQDTNK